MNHPYIKRHPTPALILTLLIVLEKLEAEDTEIKHEEELDGIEKEVLRQ